MAVTNEQIINEVTKDIALEHKERLEGKNGIELLEVFDQYPSTKNAFLEHLMNKIGKTMIYSKTWENPWAMLKKEPLKYGVAIEDLFVQMAQMKNFSEHWEGGQANAEADLIRKLKPVVVALYKKINVDKKFKTTVMEKDMRKAFTNEGGLSSLVQQIVASITNSMNYNEFEFMKKTLFRAVDGIDYNGEAIVGKTVWQGAGGGQTTLQKMHAINVHEFGRFPQELVRLIRQTVGQMKYVNDKFNMAKQKTFSKPEDLVLITTPEVNSILDVNVLAHAFNVSSTDIKTRIVEVDSFDVRGSKSGAYQDSEDGLSKPIDTSLTSALPGNGTNLPLAILIDKSFLDIRDTYQGSGTFYNPEGQYTNYFANREYLMATCLFANAVLFYTDKESSGLEK